MTQRGDDKKPIISQLYNIGDFIDAKDNQGDWRVGFIVEKNDIIKTFKVRFDGWPSKYDQVYRFGHQKLKQFRSFVLGYTGQKQYPALRPGWKFQSAQHEDKMRELHAYAIQKNQERVKSARQFNQWIRGHNYFYVDFLLTLTFPTSEQIHRVIEFFKLNIHLCVNFLKYVAQNFQKFVEHLDLNNNQHLQDLSVAKSFAFYELFDTIYTITGSYPRQASFFKDNDQLLRQEFGIVGNKDIKQAYQIKIVDYFYKSGGIQYIEKILTLIKKHNRSISFVFLHALAHLYAGLSSVIQLKARENFVKSFRLSTFYFISVTQKNIEFIGDKQMKDFYHHQVIELIREILSFSQKTTIEAEIQNWSKVVEMEIYFKMITCSFFEKKLRGITSLHEFIDKKVQYHKEHQTPDLIADGTLSKWIEHKKLFDVLFANDNPQLVKKSTQLIKYLYQRDNKMEKYIEMIWKYREGKHETAIKEIYNFIAQIPTYDRNEQFTVKLFKKFISQVDESLWDPQYVKMIKDYTVNALYAVTGQNIKETYGFEILYKYAQKNFFDDTLLGYFIEICRKLVGTTFMQKFIIECFKFIEKNHNASFHVSLLARLLRQKMIQTRNINLDGTSIIMDNIILSKNSEKQNLDEKFELLGVYLKKVEEIIPGQNFIQFWNQMIDSKGRVSFFRWIYKTKHSGQIYITSVINQETKFYLLENFWTDEYLIKHQLDEYEAIFLLELFKFVNKIEQKIIRDGLIFEVVNDNLIGLEKLHSAYRLTKDPKASEVLARGLTEVYTSGSSILEDVEIDLIEQFIERVFNQTKHYSKKNDLGGVIKMIRLIEEIINRDEEIFEVQQYIRMESMKAFQVKNVQNNDERFFRVNLLANIYSFKKLIGEKYGIPIHKFDMVVNDDEVLRYKSYFKTIGQAEIKGKILIKPKEQQNSSIKNELNHHLELLFDLMDNKEIQERVWNIVSKLPISNQIRSKLIQSENPLKILENTSFYKELYMFKVALSLEKKWWSIQAEEMVTFFLYRLNNTLTSTEIEREYVMVSAKLLQKVLQLDQISNSNVFTETFLALFEIAKRILIQTNSIQNINTFYIKKFVESFFTIGDLLNKYLEKKSLKETELDALSLMLKDKNIENLLKLCLIEYRHELIRKEFPIRLVKLATVNRQRYAHRLASIIYNDLLDCTVSTKTKNFKEFNAFFCYILQTMGDHLKKFYTEHKGFFFNKLFKLIDAELPQENSDVTNNALHSYLSLIRHVVQQVPEADLEQFFNYIFKECLFKGNLSKCKSKQTRTSIFSYFMKLIKHKKNANLIFKEFSFLHVKGLWRSRKLEDWTITHSDRLKSSTGYTGLRNLGCICYMNSFFQQIFMIEEFRRALLLSEDPSYDLTTIDDNVLYQVKKMFMNLMFSDRKAYNPKSFCMSFKDYEGNPTNVNEQMDIDEFSGILLDRLQNSLKGTKYTNLIKDTFGGVFSNEIICKGCPHFSETEESFLSLALTVKDKRSIYESLETMIKGDTLDGDNAYYCQRCDKKVSAVKRVCLKSLPNYLMVALKRFEFDFNTMQKLKVNQYCEFPQELNLEEYSYEYLRKKENPKTFESEEMRSKKYYEYKLKGVVIHIGYADSGHYYSLIQQRSGEQRWLEFNDTIVRKFNVQNLNDEAFGGQTGGLDSKEKIKNAYLLIYERVEKINSIKDEVMKLGDSFVHMDMYKEVISTIQKENFEYNIENILFSNEYVRFLVNMIQEAGKNKQTNLNLQKFIILAFLTTTMRSKTDPTSFEIIQKIWNTFGKGNHQLNSWIIQKFCDPKIYDELFRNCPIKEIKRNLVSWTILMLKDLPESDLKINLFKTIVSKITTENENNAEGLTILHSFVDQAQCLKFVVENNLIGRIHENIIRREQRLFGSVESLLPAGNLVPREFGYEQIIEKTPFELKKSKYNNEQGIVWALIYKIISNFKKSDLSYHLHPKEIEYLYLTKDKIYKLLQELQSKFDIDVFTNYLCYLSEGNYEFSQMLAEMVEKGLKEFQSKRYRQFFEIFKKLTAIEDDFADERISWIFCVIRSLKENQKYAMDCTIIELWLCKIVNENQKLATYLMTQRNITEYLSSLPLKKVPSDQLSKKNVNFSDATINKYHGIPFPTSRRGYIKLLKHVEDFYEKLLKGVYEPIHYFESGNHVAYDKLGVGDKIAILQVFVLCSDQKDKVDFEEAIIKQIFLDKLLIARKSLPNRPFWIWSDDERLTSNLNVIKDENSHELDSSKTTEMEDQIDFEI